MSTRATWWAYTLLLVLSVPWYFPAGGAEPIIFGFPLWCLVSLGAYVAVALLTVWRIDALWEADEREDAGLGPPANKPGEGKRCS